MDLAETIRRKAIQLAGEYFANPSLQDVMIVHHALQTGANLALQEVLKGRTEDCQVHHHHVVAEIPGDYYAEDEFRSDSARCMVCNTDMGWYCPKSPDHCCQYSDTPDSCDYCGMPDERK